MPAVVYRRLLRLYPREFRQQYGDDLVLAFTDLVADRGATAAWRRTSLDLIVTVPRYRLESVMNEQHSTVPITVAITVLAAAGVMTIEAGVGWGAVLLLAAAVLVLTQRSALARAIGTPSGDRGRRFAVAAIFAVIFVASIVSYGIAISDDHISSTSLLVHNAVGALAMVGAVAFFVGGLLAARGPAVDSPRPPVT